MTGRLVHDHLGAGIHQADRGGEAGEPRANDMNRACHQTNAYRKTIHNRRVPAAWTLLSTPVTRSLYLAG